MHLGLSILAFGLAGSVAAFPTLKDSQAANMATARTASSASCPFAARAAARERPQSNEVFPAKTFDPVKQKIDITGDHAFQPPKPGDQRGPCPGLNALANHGYLKRNGVTTVDDAITAVNEIYGMGRDLAGILTTLATTTSGDRLTNVFSIGGRPKGDNVPAAFSRIKGISSSHNKFEFDSSPTRGDAYINNGDATNVQMERFRSLYGLLPEDPASNYDLDVFTCHRKQSYDYSINNNPHYFNPPRGIIVSQTAHCLPPALFSNHSAETPNGVLTGDVLKTFFAISGTSGNLTYNSGYERIPENWYRREIGNDYGIVPLGTDIISMLHNVPEALLVGGNTGKVNSFTGVDFRHITNGVYNATNLLNGHNLICFAYQALHIDLTSVLKVGSGSMGVLGRVAKLFGCPELSQYDSGVFGTYPGAGDTYPSH